MSVAHNLYTQASLVFAIQELALRAVLEFFALHQDLHRSSNGLLIDFELVRERHD
jgi:hypothetical protein